MFLNCTFQKLRLFIFGFCFIFTGWALNADSQDIATQSSENINLALRRTADGLLRASGDSTSRIPVVEQINENVWQVRLDRDFKYEQLPFHLQSSLDLYSIHQPYQVKIRNCDDSLIVLGYHQFDFLNNNQVPCQGRELPNACKYIEVIFLDQSPTTPSGTTKLAWVFFTLFGLVSLWFFKKQRSTGKAPSTFLETDGLGFGNSKLYLDNQILICGNLRQTLTFRETKLLRLLVQNQNQLLERDVILKEVWVDEGILVGRSLDVFVSRLRKKLAIDPSVSIAAVHGVGYRLEIKTE